MEFFCWVCSTFAAHGEVKRAGVSWSGDEEAEEALNSSSQLDSKGGRAELVPGVLQPCHQIYTSICSSLCG